MQYRMIYQTEINPQISKSLKKLNPLQTKFNQISSGSISLNENTGDQTHLNQYQNFMGYYKLKHDGSNEKLKKDFQIRGNSNIRPNILSIKTTQKFSPVQQFYERKRSVEQKIPYKDQSNFRRFNLAELGNNTLQIKPINKN